MLTSEYAGELLPRGGGGVTRVGEDIDSGELLYAATPAATPREDPRTLPLLSWEAVARVNVVHPKLKTQRQLAPTYLAGRYAHMGVQKLRAQVHLPD